MAPGGGSAHARPQRQMRHQDHEQVDYRYKVWRRTEQTERTERTKRTTDDVEKEKYMADVEALPMTMNERSTEFEEKSAKELGFRMMKAQREAVPEMMKRRAEAELGNSLWLSRRVSAAPYFVDVFGPSARAFLDKRMADGWPLGELPVCMAMRRAAFTEDTADAAAVLELAKEHGCATQGVMLTYVACHVMVGDFAQATVLLEDVAAAPGRLFKSDKHFLTGRLADRRGLAPEDAEKCHAFALLLMSKYSFERDPQCVRFLSSVANSMEECARMQKELGLDSPHGTAECAAELGRPDLIEPMLSTHVLRPDILMWLYFGAYMEAKEGVYSLDDLVSAWLTAKRVYGRSKPGQEAFEAYGNTLLFYARRHAADPPTRDDFIEEMESKFCAYTLGMNHTPAEARQQRQRRATSKLLHEDMSAAFALQKNVKKAEWMLTLGGGYARSRLTQKNVDATIAAVRGAGPQAALGASSA
eukprot:TRINITY_DN30428_c0_g1_i1.p1 TRINITY_DN30428_c0_g1~~TRINITY_DN30428_c0_g1_i1.p1  ORF type:complete len:540 (+),score=162.74 TRINITY_DN30428_c0_g1_i1:202-1620(+)